MMNVMPSADSSAPHFDPKPMNEACQIRRGWLNLIEK